MKNQFKQGRSAILWLVVTKLLQVDLFGDLNPTQYQRLIEIVDEFLDEQDDREHFPEQMVAEISSAIIAEVVLTYDDETIERLINLSTTKTIDVGDETDILERGALVSNTITSIFPKDSTNQFVTTSPFVISMLQSSGDSTYAPALEGSFRGPNNTMLVGQIDNASVYSYLFDYESETQAIIGYRDEESDKFEFVSLNIKNLG